jgi:hypothetical protein
MILNNPRCIKKLSWLGVGITQLVWRQAGKSGFDSQQGQVIFLFFIEFSSALQSTQPFIQWVPVALSPRVKLAERETDHSLLFSSEVKNFVAVLQLPHSSSWRGAQLIIQKDNFNLLAYFSFV